MISAYLLVATSPSSREVAAPPPASETLRPTIAVGWRDEMEKPERWAALGTENRAIVTTPQYGLLSLSLGHVPPNWPYAYQWSGVAQDAVADVGRFPVLMANVVGVRGYAHLDIDVLNGEGRVAKTLRSTTLTHPGLTTINVGEALGPTTYRLRIRLIVGGPNEGCSVTYDWIRFFRKEDEVYVASHPNAITAVQANLGRR